MKKFLIIGLGISILGAAFVPLGSASREAYHQYLMQKADEYRTERRFSDRQGVLRRSLSTRSSSQRTRQTSNQLIRNLRYPASGKRYLYDNTRTEDSMRFVRPMSDSIGAFHGGNDIRITLPRPETLDPAPYDFTTYSNDYFSIQIPSGWVPEHDENGVFRLGSDHYFTVSVQRFENACTNDSFMTCAVALSKDENYLNPLEKMTNLSQIYRSARRSDNILGSFEQTDEYTESFVGLYDGDEVFVARHFVEGLDGEVFLVETQATLQTAINAIATSKVFFDSFRLYPESRRHIFNIDQ